jgi:UDP-N-acetylglucosamine 2-epimerase
MKTLLSIIGTRPEAIKMGPIVKELKKYPDKIRSLVCVTGQHKQMLKQVMNLFHISPDFALDTMQPNQELSQLTAILFNKLDPIVKETEPDWILAQGDTTSVLVAALVSFYNKIRFGHVEAGLRSGNRNKPFPEEVNRRLVDSLATLLFAPTEGNKQNLLNEGYPSEKIVVTGNTVIDALMTVAAIKYDWSKGPLANLKENQRFVLITAHRRESFGEPFREICHAIKELALNFKSSGIHFVYPVHMNPNVQRPVNEILFGISNISLVEPLDYTSLVHLMKNSELILTDSGGIQEEAPSLGVPVLIMRDTTERPEGVEVGVTKVIGTKRSQIIRESAKMLNDPVALCKMKKFVNPYGDGKAAQRIVSRIIKYNLSQ